MKRRDWYRLRRPIYELVELVPRENMNEAASLLVYFNPDRDDAERRVVQIAMALIGRLIKET